MSGARRGQVWLEYRSKTKGDGVGEARERSRSLTRSCRTFSTLLNLAYPGPHISSVYGRLVIVKLRVHSSGAELEAAIRLGEKLSPESYRN